MARGLHRPDAAVDPRRARRRALDARLAPHHRRRAAGERRAKSGSPSATATSSGSRRAGASRDEDAACPVSGELYAIYVLAAHYGSGAGQALLDAAIGRAAASLWVLEDNPRARAFYERNGFRADGTVKDDDRWGEPVREVRLVRATSRPA